MTERRDRIGREVERTLECFNDLDTIEPSLYFYTRLEQRIENPAPAGKTFPALIFNRGVLQPALVACLIIVNVCSAILLFGGISSEPESRVESLASLAREYGLIQTDTETNNILG